MIIFLKNTRRLDYLLISRNVNRCILEFLSLISVHRMFYECHVAIAAMDSILTVTICVLKSRNKETQVLWKLVSMIDDILNR